MRHHAGLYSVCIDAPVKSYSSFNATEKFFYEFINLEPGSLCASLLFQICTLTIRRTWSGLKGSHALIMLRMCCWLPVISATRSRWFAGSWKRCSSGFREVFFVPGNHDLWLRDSTYANSLDKFYGLLERCKELGIYTGPRSLENGGPRIVPLHSWYLGPHEGAGSLYVAKQGEDPDLGMWADKRAVRWPLFEGHATPAEFFLSLNDVRAADAGHTPVISFSHFLPRPELMFWTEAEFAATGLPAG